MKQFDVHRVANRRAPLVVIVQADLLSALDTRVVVPLRPLAALPKPLSRLKPVLHVEEADYLFSAGEITTLPVNRLGALATNVEDEYRTVIINALDFLFLGF